MPRPLIDPAAVDADDVHARTAALLERMPRDPALVARICRALSYAYAADPQAARHMLAGRYAADLGGLAWSIAALAATITEEEMTA